MSQNTWAGEVRNVSLLVAIGVNAEGFREILGICEGAKEDKSGWSAFLRHLVDRGLKGVELIVASRSGVRAAIEHVFAHQKGSMALCIRTIGIARARVKIGLANLTYNIRRLVFQERRPLAA
jgi:hypothetical protein